MSGTVHGARYRSGARCICLSAKILILNSFNISGVDEAALFKFWVECNRIHPRGEKFPLKDRDVTL